eukprot:1752360-Rhodomonas_salina.1
MAHGGREERKKAGSAGVQALPNPPGFLGCLLLTQSWKGKGCSPVVSMAMSWDVDGDGREQDDPATSETAGSATVDRREGLCQEGVPL